MGEGGFQISYVLLRCSSLSSDLVRTAPHPHHAHPNPPSKAFVTVPALIDELKLSTLGAPHAAALDDLKVSFERMRLFIKNELSQHHSEATSACASHCLTLGFGAPHKQSNDGSLASPCDGHTHNVRCTICDAVPATMHVLRETTRTMISAGVPASAEQAKIEEISVLIEVEFLEMEKWMTHERRARHEVAAKRRLYDDMGLDSAVLTMDWKMKVTLRGLVGRWRACTQLLPPPIAPVPTPTFSPRMPPHPPSHHHHHQFLLMMHRESMVDFFGKKGTPLACT